MARIEEAFFELLTTDPGLSALIGNRLFPVQLPEQVIKPAISYDRISGPRMMSHQGPSGTANPRYQFNCWGDTYAQSKRVADQLRFALDGLQTIIAVPTETSVEALFTAADNTLLEDYVPDIDVLAKGFEVKNGDPSKFRILGNKANINLATGTGTDFALIDAESSDAVFTCKITLFGTNPSIFFRNDGDGVSPLFGFSLNTGIAANLLRLFRTDSSGQTLLDSVGQSYFAPTEISLEVTLAGSSIICKDLTNGIQVSATDAFNQDKRFYGIGQQAGNFQVKWDDFKVVAADEVRIQAAMVVDDRDEFEEQTDQHRTMVDVVIWHDEATS